MIDELCCHVVSDEPAEDINKRSEQRFNRRRNWSDAVQRGSSGDALQVNRVVVNPPKVFQCGMLGLHSRKCAREQGVAPVVTQRVAQIAAHAQAGVLQRGGDGGRRVLPPGGSIMGEKSAGCAH